jgi:hypothetical protein
MSAGKASPDRGVEWFAARAPTATMPRRNTLGVLYERGVGVERID